ncbi:Spo0B domain-containing protein [Desmospora profundinema]|uniref:SpoOB alpha-helical domain-containing protein n=1 Tax=Desmospora profundinema TaxID=1571184 RepID=A0ABU1INT5_9BACL|nr:Spo0B domain-containing protein [Desmospora profundinema]MDR6226403.1 hypothetical protein [Desmospora profundinema]
MRDWWQAWPMAAWMLLMALQPWGPFVGLALAVFGCFLLVWCWKHREGSRQAKQEKQEKQAQRFLTLWSRQRHDWLNHIQVLMAYTALKQTGRVSDHLQTLASELAAEREAARVKCPSLALFLSTLRVEWMEWKTEVIVSPNLSDLAGPEAVRVEQVLRHVMDWLTGLARTVGDPGELWIYLEKDEDKGVSVRLEGESESWPAITESDWFRLRHTMDPWNVQVEPEERGMTVHVPCKDT